MSSDSCNTGTGGPTAVFESYAYYFGRTPPSVAFRGSRDDHQLRDLATTARLLESCTRNGTGRTSCSTVPATLCRSNALTQYAVVLFPCLCSNRKSPGLCLPARVRPGVESDRTRDKRKRHSLSGWGRKRHTSGPDHARTARHLRWVGDDGLDIHIPIRNHRGLGKLLCQYHRGGDRYGLCRGISQDREWSFQRDSGFFLLEHTFGGGTRRWAVCLVGSDGV